MLISVVVLAVAIIGVALTSQGTPQKLPAVSAIISSSGDRISIYHDGGDSLTSEELSILVNGREEPFTKSGSPANHGHGRSAKPLSIPPRFRHAADRPGHICPRIVYDCLCKFWGHRIRASPDHIDTSHVIHTCTFRFRHHSLSRGCGSTVSITNLAGANFQNGATVRLTRSGYPDIPGTSVGFISATQLTCTFNLAGTAAGQWNVVVTNPDGKSRQLPNGFTVSNSSSHRYCDLPGYRVQWCSSADRQHLRYQFPVRGNCRPAAGLPIPSPRRT